MEFMKRITNAKKGEIMARSKRKPCTPTAPEDQQNRAEPSSEESASDWSQIRHFTPRDFTCKCNGFCDHRDVISEELVAKLDKICELTGVPITILSGTRCEQHNRKVGGRMRSSHIPRGEASHGVDIRCPDPGFRFAFLAAALPMFNRIGIGRDFIHIDDDPDLLSNQIWVYDPSMAADQVEPQ
jgi:zinc D-Ala-D-Ala carboxypeptidase